MRARAVASAVPSSFFSCACGSSPAEGCGALESGRMLYSRAPMKARSPLAIIFLTVAFDLLGFGLIIPVAPYYAQHLHATETEVALLGTIYSAMQLLFVPLWGRLSDRVGRRPVLLFSILATAVSMTIFGAAQSYGWL